jgi:uncharacterized C2H2 Zn-finger protein
MLFRCGREVDINVEGIFCFHYFSFYSRSNTYSPVLSSMKMSSKNTCPTCNKVMGLKNYSRHVKSHSSEFKCPYCPSAIFNRKDSLKRHLKLHAATLNVDQTLNDIPVVDAGPFVINYEQLKENLANFTIDLPLLSQDSDDAYSTIPNVGSQAEPSIADDNLSQLASEQINGNYWYANYGPFRVVMMKDNAYINASSLCTAHGKDYKEWLTLNGGQQLIEALQRMLELERLTDYWENSNAFKVLQSYGKVCLNVQFRNNTEMGRLLSGTYCHPDLIPSIASWLSTDFTRVVGKIANANILEINSSYTH